MFRKSLTIGLGIAVSLLPTSMALGQTLRTWKDATGKFEVEARLCRVDHESIVLRKPDGNIIIIPLKRLSNEDQRFVDDDHVMWAMFHMETYRSRKAYDLVKQQRTLGEKAVYATLIAQNLKSKGVDEFDRERAKEIFDDIRTDLESSDEPLNWYLAARLYFEFEQSDESLNDKVIPLLNKCRRESEPYGMTLLAYLYYAGDGVEKNDDKSYELYDTVASKFGCSLSLCNAGLYTYSGLGTAQDRDAGKRMIDTAAKRGNLFAMCRMAEILREELEDIDIPKISAGTVSALKKGDRNARRTLRTYGTALKKRERLLNSAEQWANKAIKGGFAGGYYQLARLKMTLAAEETDSAKSDEYSNAATELLEKAAERDQPNAVTFLAQFWASMDELEKAKRYADQMDRISTSRIGQGRIGQDVIDETKRLVSSAIKDKEDHEKLLKSVTLIVESWTWRRTGGGSFVEVVGEVTNNSAKKLEAVAAIATFKTSGGKVVTTDSSIIDYNPLLAGQTSPFKTITTWNPEMKTCSLNFKFLLGGRIPSIPRNLDD